MNKLITIMNTKKANAFFECLHEYQNNPFVETDIDAIFLKYHFDGECHVEITSSRDIVAEVFSIGEYIN